MGPEEAGRLSQAQRSALSQFFKGSISAGELSRRLALARTANAPAFEGPAEIEPDAAPRGTGVAYTIAIVVLAIAGAGVGAAVGLRHGAASRSGARPLPAAVHRHKVARAASTHRHAQRAGEAPSATPLPAATNQAAPPQQPPPAKHPATRLRNHASPKRQKLVPGSNRTRATTPAGTESTPAGTTSTAPAPPSAITTTTTATSLTTTTSAGATTPQRSG